MTVEKTIIKAGRGYKVDSNGASDVSVKYQLVLSEPLGATELPVEFLGVPKVGSEHPTRPGFYVLGYDVNQPDGAGKSTLDITVKYGPADITITPGEQGEPDVVTAVTEWGWDDATGDKELITSVAVGNEAAKPVLNSAGQPFDTVPTVSVPTPTFTKVVRSSQRQSGYSAFMCTVNDAQVVIGDMTCAAGTLLCTIAEKKLIGEWQMPYEYTIHLRYRSNIVSNTYPQIASGEIGWDAAVVDAGTKAINSNTGKLETIMTMGAESKQPCAVTSPELLDGHGHQVTRDSQGQATPTVLTFHAYPRAHFPDWFYSEPPTPQPPSDTNTVVDNGGGTDNG